MSHLRPCSACARHVRANEAACPFCAAPLTIEASAPTPPHERLGRAARIALGGVAAVALVAGCEPNPSVAPAYGGPPIPTATVDPADAGTPTGNAVKKPPPPPPPDDGNMQKPYGAPPADGYDVFDV